MCTKKRSIELTLVRLSSSLSSPSLTISHCLSHITAFFVSHSYACSYNNRFLYRAGLTVGGGIGALPEEEALDYVRARETQFTVLNGNGIYRLVKFSPPPVPSNGFWSLTVYNLTSLFLPEGLQKYNVGDRTPGLVYNSGEWSTTWPTRVIPTHSFSLTNARECACVSTSRIWFLHICTPPSQICIVFPHSPLLNLFRVITHAVCAWKNVDLLYSSYFFLR